MAARAYAAYTDGKYEEALSHLSQLTFSSDSSTTGSSNSHAATSATAGEPPAYGDSDFRVLHNRALCEHGARGFKGADKLEAALYTIQAQMRGKVRGDSTEEADQDQETAQAHTGPAAVTAVLGSSGGAASAAAAAGLADLDAGLTHLDAGASVILYNLSALHFQSKQYGAAQAVLEHLFQHIEPLDDFLAIHVCFLLLDVLCHAARGNLHTEDSRTRFAAQTAAVLAFLERPHALNSTSGGNGDSGGGAGESSRQDDGSGRGSADQTEFTFRLHLYKAKILLLQEQTKSSKKEVKSALEIFQRELRGSSDASGAGASGGSGPGGRGSTGENQRGRTKEADQPRTFVPVPPAGVQNAAALYLKANLEYLRDNPRKALKLLASCHGFQGAEEYSGPGEAVGPPYFNNMGCLHHKLRRHHVALHYFQKALMALGREGAPAKNGSATVESGGGSSGSSNRTGGYISPAATCEVLYNTGLQLLLTEKPEEALRCFERAALLFHNRPHLWLRMAECSITHHRLRSQGCRGEGNRGVGTTAKSNSSPKDAGASIPAAAVASGGGRGGKNGGAGTGAGAAGDAAGGQGKAPLPWVHISKGQQRRVLLPGKTEIDAEQARAEAARFSGGSAIPPLDEDGVAEVNGSAAAAAHPSPAQGTGTARSARGKRARSGGCSLTHASRCLHNVLYLCAASRKGAKEAAAAGATGFLGGQASILGMSPRLVSKNLALAQQPEQANQGGVHRRGDANNGGDGADVGGGGGRGGRSADGSVDEISQIALVDLAFVHLSLNDPVAALSFSGRALATRPSPTSTHLAHLYAAEALCVLGRPSEALEHLAPLSEDSSVAAATAAAWSSPRRPTFSPPVAAPKLANAPGAGAGTGVTTAEAPATSAAGGGGSGAASSAGVGDNGMLSPDLAAEARASLHVNLAAVHALQGNLAQAERCARTAMGFCPGSVKVLRIAVYVLVRQGNITEALQVLKEGRMSLK